MKRLFISFIIILFAATAYAYDFSAVCPSGQTLYYNYSDGGAVVTYPRQSGSNFYSGYTKPTGDLIIPDSVLYQGVMIPIVRISNCAFYDCTGLASVKFPPSLTSIEYRTFQGCTGLTSVEFPPSLTIISSNAFYGCVGLTSVEFPQSLTHIYDNAFNGCTGLTSVEFPPSLTNIGNSAFIGCTGLQRLVIPDGAVVSLSDGNQFYGCPLRYIYIGSGVTTIGDGTFASSVMDTLVFNAKNCTVNNSSSGRLKNLRGDNMRLVIGDSVEVLNNNAFYECSFVRDTLILPPSLTSIGGYSFYGCTNLTSVDFPSSLTRIEANSFQGCTGLTFVDFPSSLTRIEANSFQGCTGLTSVVLPPSLTIIQGEAFRGCTNLASVELPPSLTYIDNNVFQGCIGLRRLVIADGAVVALSQQQFAGCPLRYIYIGSGVTSIGDGTFTSSAMDTLVYNAKNCTCVDNNGYSTLRNLRGDNMKLIIGDSVEVLNHYTFRECSFVKDTLILPPSLTSIGYQTFKGCTGLTSLTLPSSLTSMGGSAFTDCTGLQRLVISDGAVVSINRDFENCSALKYIYIGSGVTSIGRYGPFSSSVMDTLVYNAKNCTCVDGSVLQNLRGNNMKLIIGDSVEVLNDYTFYRCSFVRDTLILPPLLTSIGIAVFEGCEGLTAVYFPPLLTSIGSLSFSGCTGLTSVKLPSLLTSIGHSVFASCTGLERLVIADGAEVSFSDGQQFYGCPLRYIYIGTGVASIGNVAFASSVVDTLIYNARNSTCSYRKNDETVSALQELSGSNMRLIIGDSVETLNDYTFRQCPFVKDTFILPPLLNTIGNYVFSKCYNLETILFNDNIVSIGNHAFENLDITGNMVIPASVENIGNFAFGLCHQIDHLTVNGACIVGDSAFYGCNGLITATLGNDFSNHGGSIGNSAFQNCVRLVNVNFKNSFEGIGNCAFQDCPRLINVHFGKNIQYIGAGAFKNDIRLVYSELPDSLKTIGGGQVYDRGWKPNGAFSNCTSFGGDITIPANVSSIGDYAFSGCKNITSLTMRPVNPPTISAHTFDSVNVNIPVYVPCGRVLNYYVADYWENFPNLLEAEPYEVTVSSNDEMMGIAVVAQAPTCSNPRARLSATAQEGYHFLQWSDGNLANPRIVELSSDSAFEAQFAINYISIQVHSSDSIKGSVSGTGRYYYASPVTLTATANNNYHFLHWSDGSTQNPRYMAATHDSTFTAVFASNVSTITIGNNNPDMGTVSGGGVYYYQNYVTFSASPHYGYHFTQWNDGNVANPRTIMVDRDTTFTASFALNLYAVSVNSVNSTMGYVEGTGNYTYNTTIGIAATPNYGYHFTQWNDGNTNNPRTIVISKDTMFTAQFAANDYSLSVSSNYPAMGSAYGAGTFNYNTQTTIAAAANYGYHFLQWSDGNTENPRVVTVTHNTEYEAQFAPNFYTITTNASNPVFGSASGGGSFNYLSSISIVATPNYGYHFTQWSDGNTDNPRTITVMANGTYTAQFAINSYAITVAPNNAGRGVVSGSGSYVYNTATTITATPYYGYHFTQWNDGNTENPRTVVITQDAQYTAQFDYNSYQLRTYSNDVTIGNVTGGGTYDFNSMVSVTAIPVSHYHFERWNDSVTDNPRTVILTRDTSLTALFAIDRHFVEVRSSNSAMGTTGGSGEYNYGASVFISATPNYGYHFVSWSDGNTQDPRRIVVENDSVFFAIFGINSYTLTTACNDTTMGSVTPSSAYNYNTSVTISAEPSAGHHFVSWNDGSTDNPRTLVLTCDSTLTALFAINTYLLSVSPNDTAMGSVTGSGIYTYHEQVVLTAAARTHYHFIRWNDGNTQNPRIVVVANDSNFVAQFVEDDQFSISVISTDANAGTTTGSGQYYVGTQTYISAVPDEHYLFSRWTDGSVDNPRFITVLGNATYIACFEPKEYEISVFPNNEAMGSVSGGGTFSYGTDITICAYPSVGHHFVSWNDGEVSAIRTVTVEGTAVYIAEFAEGVGITDETGNPFEIMVYPNPTHSTFQVHISGSDQLPAMEITITDLYGRCLSRKKASGSRTEIDLSNASSGLYFVNILSEGHPIATKKVVKE